MPFFFFKLTKTDSFFFISWYLHNGSIYELRVLVFILNAESVIFHVIKSKNASFLLLKKPLN